MRDRRIVPRRHRCEIDADLAIGLGASSEQEDERHERNAEPRAAVNRHRKVVARSKARPSRAHGLAQSPRLPPAHGWDKSATPEGEMAIRMAKGFGVLSIAAAVSLAGAAGAQEAPGGAPPSQPAVSVSLGGSASAPAPGPSAPAADQGTSSAPAPHPIGERNPANYEFAFVSVGANQAWNIAGHFLYFGMGGGVGPPLYRYGKMGDNSAGWNPNLDIVYGNMFLRVAPVPYVDVDFGPKISIGATLFDVKGAPQSAFSYGGYADLRVGSRTIKLGPRFEYMKVAHSDFYESGWILTPLMLRVVH